MLIPNTFENFEQRQLQRGMETRSRTIYKGFEICLRAYSGSGIYYKISKLEGEKRVKIRQKTYAFIIPINLLNEAKKYIDDNLIGK